MFIFQNSLEAFVNIPLNIHLEHMIPIQWRFKNDVTSRVKNNKMIVLELHIGPFFYKYFDIQLCTVRQKRSNVDKSTI